MEKNKTSACDDSRSETERGKQNGGVSSEWWDGQQDGVRVGEGGVRNVPFLATTDEERLRESR